MSHVLALVLVFAAGQSAAHPPEVTIPGTDITIRPGWRVSIEGGCRAAVPLEWRVVGQGIFSSPAGLRFTMMSVLISNWPAHKAGARETFEGAATIREDSEWRFWLALRTEAGVQHYVAVNAGTHACVGVLELPPSASENDTVRTIVGSIGPAPPR